MWNNKKQQKIVSLMSNLQTYYHFKLDFQKVDQHTTYFRMITHLHVSMSKPFRFLQMQLDMAE